MPTVALKIDDLALDQRNPRSTPSSSQREALQKILTGQGPKLAELAESIVEEQALNPMERMLVVKEDPDAAGYVVLEGNRRTAALKILLNPAVLGDLEVRPAVRRRLEAAASKFDRATVEPIDAFALDSREGADYWLRLRHTGENEGRGVVDWSTQQQTRFVGTSPSLQAVDFVREHGKLTDEQKHALHGRFITTVARLLEAPDVRQRIGVELQANKLLTGLPADEVIKPLRRIVLDLALGIKRVTDLKLVDQMVAYVDSFGPNDLPDLGTMGELIEIGEVNERRPTDSPPADGEGETGSSGTGNGAADAEDGAGAGGSAGSGSSGGNSGGGQRRGADPSKREYIIPKGVRLNVTESRIAAIHNELKKIKLKDAPNAIAVLLRVFIELSIDDYMTRNGLDPTYAKGGRKHFKSFQDKIGEVLQHMIDHGDADPKVFVPLKSAIHDAKSPLHFELLHSYVHNKFSTPDADRLKGAWDQATPLLLKAWP